MPDQLKVNPEWEVHPRDVKQWLDEKQELLIIDVRRQNEWDATHLPAATLVPLDQLEAKLDTLAAWKERRVVVHCHHGVRSMNAAILLRRKGFQKVYSMAGGIDAWSLLVAPAVRRY